MLFRSIANARFAATINDTLASVPPLPTTLITACLLLSTSVCFVIVVAIFYAFIEKFNSFLKVSRSSLSILSTIFLFLVLTES